MKTTALEELHIRSVPIGNDGLETLAELVPEEKLGALKNLDCLFCGAEGGDGGRAFAKLLIKTTALEEVEIAFDRDGWDALSVIFPQEQLIALKVTVDLL
eukprot:Filipodium_phascolosomae@DN3044_c0_g1_i1.p1